MPQPSDMRNKTLVYFASGHYKHEYFDLRLRFGKIILVDNCFRNRWNNSYNIVHPRTLCLGMDCLEAVDVMLQLGVKVDAFVNINEGLVEGGGTYPISSDMFLAYAMPLLKDRYIHLFNRKYYRETGTSVRFQLPYRKSKITAEDPEYLNPAIFTRYPQWVDSTTNYVMNRKPKPEETRQLANGLVVRFVNDSIWRHTDALDLLYINFYLYNQDKFFAQKPKHLLPVAVSGKLSNLVDHCETNRLSRLGIAAPLGNALDEFLGLLESADRKFPKEVVLFYLNREGYDA